MLEYWHYGTCSRLNCFKKYIKKFYIGFQTGRVPWRSIASSPVVWACATAHVCNNWTNYTLLTSLPMFMKEALKFNIKSVSLSVPMTKRKRSYPVLWQKPLHQQKCQKGKVPTGTTPQNSSIKQRLRTGLGRSVGVTTATELVWLTWFTGPPFHSPQQPCNYGPNFPLPATAVQCLKCLKTRTNSFCFTEIMQILIHHGTHLILSALVGCLSLGSIRMII